LASEAAEDAVLMPKVLPEKRQQNYVPGKLQFKIYATAEIHFDNQQITDLL
jgi:hypothetical protein